MSSKKAGTDSGEGAPKGKPKTLILVALPVLLAGIAAGLWFSGIAPKMLAGSKKATAAHEVVGAPPVYADVPEIITNLNVPGRRQSYLKLRAKLQLGSAADASSIDAAMPRVLDLFQTYLRDMRPEELRGAEGSYRLREELIDRATVAVAPAHVRDVLFVEMIVQ